jgi:hypothetical protein
MLRLVLATAAQDGGGCDARIGRDWSCPEIATPETESSWAYFILDQQAAALKVGVSMRVKQRLSSLKCGTPNETSLLGLIEGDRQTEQLIHRMLMPFHHREEWFKAYPVVMRFVQSLVEVDRLAVCYSGSSGDLQG